MVRIIDMYETWHIALYAQYQIWSTGKCVCLIRNVSMIVHVMSHNCTLMVSSGSPSGLEKSELQMLYFSSCYKRPWKHIFSIDFLLWAIVSHIYKTFCQSRNSFECFTWVISVFVFFSGLFSLVCSGHHSSPVHHALFTKCFHFICLYWKIDIQPHWWVKMKKCVLQGIIRKVDCNVILCIYGYRYFLIVFVWLRTIRFCIRYFWRRWL